MRTRQLKAGPAKSAAVFAALGDERRLRLVARLCADGPVSITGLAAGSGVSRQAITKHLHVLARAGLVRSMEQGRERLYELNLKQLQQAREYLETISREWDQALGRLKLLLESE